jgi:hypothetical protein
MRDFDIIKKLRTIPERMQKQIKKDRIVKEEINKKVEEQHPMPYAPPRPSPVTPTKEPKKKPVSPIKPTPGQKPKPKGQLGHDLELFIAARKGIKEMAFEPGKTDKYINPEWRQWIEQGGGELKELLPDLSKTEQSYIEMITSEQYQKMVDHIEKATGLDAEAMDLPSFTSIFQQAIYRVLKIERNHSKELEQLALKTVLELDEFEMVKDAYENEDVKIEVKLTTEFPELQAAHKNDELTDAEELNKELFGVLDGTDEMRLKRRFANMLIHGNATLKLHLYNLVTKELEAMDKDLPALYGILASGIELGYWALPRSAAQAATDSGAIGGQEEVEPEGEEYTIKASSIAFPYLINELVKGIEEWLAINPDTAEASKHDTIQRETEDVLTGPGIVKAVQSYLGTADQKYLPLLKRKFLQLSKDEIKAVLARSEQGQRLMKELLRQAKEEWAEYEHQKNSEE